MPRPFAKTSLPAAYFPLGGPVPPADLVGREGYIRRAVARLADGNHILIAGPRRIGKTSVMLEILRRLRRRGGDTAHPARMGAAGLRGPGRRPAGGGLRHGGGGGRGLAPAEGRAP